MPLDIRFRPVLTRDLIDLDFGPARFGSDRTLFRDVATVLGLYGEGGCDCGRPSAIRWGWMVDLDEVL